MAIQAAQKASNGQKVEKAISPITELNVAPDGELARLGNTQVMIDLSISKPIAAINVPFISEMRRNC